MAVFKLPNVPINFPGVPTVNVKPGAQPFEPSGKQLDRDGLAGGSNPKKGWGIYDAKGGLAVDPDSIVALEAMREFRVSDYPVEKGGFASYNKVATPAETRVTMTKGGSDAKRSEFLDTIKDLIETTELFDIVTLDRVFTRRNIVRYDYRRTSKEGATLLTVELLAIEVRETAESAFTNSKAPSGQNATQNGAVQPTAPTPQQTPTPSTPAPSSKIGKILGLPPGSDVLATARKMGELVSAGATLYDVASKGVPLQVIPTISRAAQDVSVTLAGQPVKLNIRQKEFGMFVDIFKNDVPVVAGALARCGEPLIHSSHAGFLGDLFFHDTQGRSDPVFRDMGSRFVLLFAGPE